MSALIAIIEAALAVANVALAADALGSGLVALHEPGHAADAVACACAKFSAPPPPHMSCTACGADWRCEGCLCRLLATHEAPKALPEPKARDFTDGFEVGQNVRQPKGTIQLCPKCDRTGVAVIVPRWRYKPAHTRYVHAAEVQAGMCTMLDSCTVEKPVKKPRAKRVRTEAPDGRA